jgi:hypothetical protein
MTRVTVHSSVPQARFFFFFCLTHFSESKAYSHVAFGLAASVLILKAGTVRALLHLGGLVESTGYRQSHNGGGWEPGLHYRNSELCLV